MSAVAKAVTRIERAAGPAPERTDRSVAVHLGRFAIGVLTPILLIGALMLLNTARLWRDDSLHDARTIAQHLNATIETELEKSIAIGQTLAAALSVDADNYDGFEAQAREVSNRLGETIVVRDLSGQQILNTATSRDKKLPKSNENILAIDRLAVARKMTVVSDLVTGTIRSRPVVIAVVPVFNKSEVVRFISVSLSPRRMSEILAGLPDGWIAGVVGSDGRLIGRNIDPDRFIGTANPAFMDAVTAREGAWTGTSREGLAIAGFYIRSPLSGWVVSVAVPETTLRAPVLWAMGGLGGLVALALCLSLWLGWRLSRRISSPIRELVVQARALGEGRQPRVARSSVGEINDVAAALLLASVELDRRAEAERRAAEAVRANEERLQLVQDTARIGTIDWDIATDRAMCSPRYYEMFSLPADTPAAVAHFVERIHTGDRSRLEQSRDQLFRRGGGPFEEEFRVLTPDGGERWVHVRGRLDLKDGMPVRLLGASIEITERKLYEDHLRFLLRELSHRSKNLLAVIQAMATQTAKSSETVDVFRRRFGERLMGLAASHDLLVNQNWLGASVESLVRGQLSAFIAEDDPRLRIQGPAVDLKSEAAEALGLALHELASNSMRHGALRDDTGQVEIFWAVDGPGQSGAQELSVAPGDGGADTGSRRFRMDWIEHSVLPVSPPSHKGFGRMVIEHTVEATLNGTVTLSFLPSGLRWHIDAPGSCLAPLGQEMAD